MHPKGRVILPNGIEPEPAERRTFRISTFDAVASPREFAKLQRRIDGARIRVPISAVYPLARAADAHRHLDRGRVLGRMVFGVRR
jgi:NADPH:quinone reductase-like Zn-dependent oxidoreductase